MSDLVQHVLPGFEDYACTDQCLTCKLCPGVCSPPDLSACPYPQCLCPANDWGLEDEVEYPEFFGWRLEHLTAKQEKLLCEPGSNMMILTPDCLDQFYPEPPGDVYRCNRCHSTNIVFGVSWIVCASCEYNEPLIDFPSNNRGRDDLEEILARIQQGKSYRQK